MTRLANRIIPPEALRWGRLTRRYPLSWSTDIGATWDVLRCLPEPVSAPRASTA